MYDTFISYASEDQNDAADPLARALVDKGLNIWYAEFVLSVGDSLSECIDRGLANSRFGVVIVSEHFFNKQWPRRELRGLTAREMDGQKTILPVWHNISKAQVMAFSPPLADLKALETSDGIAYVADKLVEVIRLSLIHI